MNDLGWKFWIVALAACVVPGLSAGASPAVPAAVPVAVPPAVLAAEQQRIAVIQRASASTVAIFDRSGEGGGSGVLVSSSGLALTNFHVTAPCGPAMQCGLDDGKMYDAVLVGIDPVGDVALIQLLGRDDFTPAVLGDSDQVEVGDWVFTAGNPLLLANDFQPSIAYGLVSGVHRYQYPAGTLLEYADCLQTDAAINPGNSGGPLFDDQGRLIGINGRGSFEKRGRVNVGVGYAISINQIKHFLSHLQSGRIVDHATLGALVSTTAAGPVRVDDILETSDAYRRGLRYGDEIVEFAGREIRSANRLKNALGIFPPGWLVPLSYRRGGQRFDTRVQLPSLHDPSELYTLIQKQGQRPAENQLPGPPGKRPPGNELPEEGPSAQKMPAVPAGLPAVVAERYTARRGYANYWYNQQKQLALWENYQGRDAFQGAGLDWQLTAGDQTRIAITPQQATMTLPTLESGANFAQPLSTQLSPPNSGGLLLALHLWQRLLDKGLSKYGEVYYLGQLPRRPDGEWVDCLVGVYAGIETYFQFDSATGELVGLLMHAGDEPCQLCLSDYGPLPGGPLPGDPLPGGPRPGRTLPRHWQVYQGDRLFVELQLSDWQFAEAGGSE
jgi:S1-C subfamily serine protease